MDLKSIFPLLDFLYAERDDLLFYLLIGDEKRNDIQPGDFPLIFVGEDTTFVPPVIFQGPQEIHRHCFISQSFWGIARSKKKLAFLTADSSTPSSGKKQLLLTLQWKKHQLVKTAI